MFCVVCFDEPQFIPANLVSRETKTQKTPWIPHVWDESGIQDCTALPTQWDTVYRDRLAMQKLRSFLTRKLLFGEADFLCIPKGGWFAIQGGLLEDAGPAASSPLELDHASVYFRTHYENGDEKVEEKEQLRNKTGQGELSAFMFCRGCRDMAIMVESDTFNIIPISLLCSRDRCDQPSHHFHNQLFLRIVRGKQPPLLVDCNRLYENIGNSELLHGHLRPELSLAAALSVCGCESMSGYAFGIGAEIRLETFFSHCEKSASSSTPAWAMMCGVNREEWMVEPNTGDMLARRYLGVDEPSFQAYTHALFMRKYGGSAKNKKRRTQQQVFAHTRELKDARKRMPTTKQCKAHARRLSWILNYWTNGYRDRYDKVADRVLSYVWGDLKYAKQYNGASVYGYTLEGECTDEVVPLAAFIMLRQKVSSELPFIYGYRFSQLTQEARTKISSQNRDQQDEHISEEEVDQETRAKFRESQASKRTRF